MDPAEILIVRFHISGEFLRIGPTLNYVGGDEATSEIERDKLSLQEDWAVASCGSSTDL